MPDNATVVDAFVVGFFVEHEPHLREISLGSGAARLGEKQRQARRFLNTQPEGYGHAAGELHPFSGQRSYFSEIEALRFVGRGGLALLDAVGPGGMRARR